MGSITKTFVAVSVLRLRDAGRLDLIDRFEDHVPGSALDDVTIAQLLSHGAGVQAETNGAVVGADARWRLGRAGWAGRGIAGGTAVPRRSALPLHERRLRGARRARGQGARRRLVRGRPRDLLEPLGMTRTTTRPAGRAAQGLAVHPFADVLLPEPEHDAGAMAPAGQLWTTVQDLARWAVFVGGDTGDLLSADTLAEMYEPHTVVDDPGQAWTTAHGLGWQVWNVDGTRYAGHGGSMPGFLAGLRVEVECGDGVVLLTNTTSGMGQVATDLLTAFVEREPAPPEPWSAAGDPTALDLVGTWHWGPSVSTARVVGEHLVLGEPGQVAGARFAADRRPTSGSGWTATTRASRSGWCGPPTARRRTSTSRRSGSRRTPYDPAADVPGGVDESGWR